MASPLEAGADINPATMPAVDSLGSLSRLPLEIRLKIFGLAIPEFDLCVPADPNRDFLIITLPVQPPLFAVSKQVSIEAQDAFYSTTILKITIFQERLNASVDWTWRGRREREFYPVHLAPFVPDFGRIQNLEMKVVFNHKCCGGMIKIVKPSFFTEEYEIPEDYKIPGEDEIAEGYEIAHKKESLVHTAIYPPSAFRARRQTKRSGNLMIPVQKLLKLLSPLTDSHTPRRSCRLIWESPERRCLLESGTYENSFRLSLDYNMALCDPSPNIDVLAHPMALFFANLASFQSLTMEYHVLSTDQSWIGDRWYMRRANRIRSGIQDAWGPFLGPAVDLTLHGGERGYLCVLNRDGETEAERKARKAEQEELNRIKAEKQESVKKAMDLQGENNAETQETWTSIFGHGEPIKDEWISLAFWRDHMPLYPPAQSDNIGNEGANPAACDAPLTPFEMPLWTWKLLELRFSPRSNLDAPHNHVKGVHWKTKPQTVKSHIIGVVREAMLERYHRVNKKHGTYYAYRRLLYGHGGDPADTSDEEGASATDDFGEENEESLHYKRILDTYDDTDEYDDENEDEDEFTSELP